MTRKSTRSRDDLLRALLLPIFREWGPDAVHRCLAELEDLPAGIEGNSPSRPSARQAQRRKPSAVDLATRLEAPQATKASLLDLASLFDRKQFLPTASDVRHFLELRGQDTGV